MLFNNSGHPESNGALLKKEAHKKTSLIKKKIWLSNKVKCTVLEKAITAKFEVIENFYSDLPRINTGWKSNS